MTSHSITDEQVAALPVHEGRAELLEEIMSTPVDRVDHTARNTGHLTPHRGRRLLASVAAVAAVAATVGGLAALRLPHHGAEPDGTSFGDSGQQTLEDGPRVDSLGIPSVPGGAFVALDRSGWAVTGLFQDSTGTDLLYSQGDAQVDLTTYPEAQYQSYVADRNADASSGGSLTLLGREAQEWTYAEDDHTVIRAPQGGAFLEVRATGLSEQDFHAVLDDLVQTDAAGFAGSLPEGVVSPANRDEAIRHLLQGVDTPPGFTTADVKMTGFNDAYQAAAHVAGAVGCAWIHVWADGTPDQKQAAVDALAGSRSWPLLQRIANQGGYSSGFWDLADELRTGHDDKGNPVDPGALRDAVCS